MTQSNPQAVSSSAAVGAAGHEVLEPDFVFVPGDIRPTLRTTEGELPQGPLAALFDQRPPNSHAISPGNFVGAARRRNGPLVGLVDSGPLSGHDALAAGEVGQNTEVVVGDRRLDAAPQVAAIALRGDSHE